MVNRESVLAPSIFTLRSCFYDITWSLSKWKHSERVEDWNIQFILILFHYLEENTGLCFPLTCVGYLGVFQLPEGNPFLCLSLKSAQVFEAASTIPSFQWPQSTSWPVSSFLLYAGAVSCNLEFSWKLLSGLQERPWSFLKRGWRCCDESW